MAKQTTDETIRLEKEAKVIEDFIAQAPSEKLRSMLSSIFSDISSEYIMRRQYPGAYMYEGELEHRIDEARNEFRGNIFDSFKNWTKK